MPSDALHDIARAAKAQAAACAAMGDRIASLRAEVSGLIGSTATHADREMCDLLATAAASAKHASVAFERARRQAEAAAAKAEHERSRAARSRTQRPR